MLFQNISG